VFAVGGRHARRPPSAPGSLRVRVKICGITSWADAKLAIDAGADALGFNFYPPSPRAVTPSEAWGMIRRLPPLVEAVGVFVNWSPEAVGALGRAVGLHAVQLHGDEPPGVVAELAEMHRVIKAFRVRRGFRPDALRRYRHAAAFLLDGFHLALPGGTGQPFDWRLAQRARRYGRIVLAGGLAPENVRRAIREVEPFAIDVCSGVESRPGRKDPRLLRELMREVEMGNLELSELKERSSA
jgi:phosphoribosylanthranilate isomerase